MTVTDLEPNTLFLSIPFYQAFRNEIAVPYPQLFKDGPEGLRHFLSSWRALMDCGLGAIFVAYEETAWEDAKAAGILLATVTPDLFDGSKVATEHAWHVLPSARGGGAGRALLDRYEAWAKEQGAARIVMSHFVEGMPDMEAYFRKRGFVPLETHYLKALE